METFLRLMSEAARDVCGAAARHNFDPTNVSLTVFVTDRPEWLNESPGRQRHVTGWHTFGHALDRPVPAYGAN